MKGNTMSLIRAKTIYEAKDFDELRDVICADEYLIEDMVYQEASRFDDLLEMYGVYDQNGDDDAVRFMIIPYRLTE